MAVNKYGTKLSHWAIAVKFRDGKCKKCGEDGSLHSLHAHHIKTRKDHPELSLDINNGITLCAPCHKREHERMRPKRDRGASKPHRATLEERINKLSAKIAELTEKQLSKKPPADRSKNRHNKEARRIYMREYMRDLRKSKTNKNDLNIESGKFVDCSTNFIKDFDAVINNTANI